MNWRLTISKLQIIREFLYCCALVLFLWIFGVNVFPGEHTRFYRGCVDDRGIVQISGTQCSGRMRYFEVWFKAGYSANSVSLQYGKAPLVTLKNCTVNDGDNWICKDPTAGEYYCSQGACNFDRGLEKAHAFEYRIQQLKDMVMAIIDFFR